MAECIVLKGGSGADLDVVTAEVPDVLAGKVIVGADGEPLTGTMANNGAVSQALNAGGKCIHHRSLITKVLTRHRLTHYE